jgi:hypothetical protein
VRDRHVTIGNAGELTGGAVGEGGWLALTQGDGATVTLELTEGELLMAVEALAMVYADAVGARADSIAYGVMRTIRNRTQAARERRQRQHPEAA